MIRRCLYGLRKIRRLVAWPMDSRHARVSRWFTYRERVLGRQPGVAVELARTCSRNLLPVAAWNTEHICVDTIRFDLCR